MRRSNSSRPCYQKTPEKRNPKKGKNLIMLDNKSVPGISKEISSTNTLVGRSRYAERFSILRSRKVEAHVPIVAHVNLQFLRGTRHA